jgi:ribosomal protein S21
MATNVRVDLRRNESSGKLIRRFIKKVKNEKILEIYRQRTNHYIKPSVRRKMKRKKAIRAREKLERRQQEKMLR